MDPQSTWTSSAKYWATVPRRWNAVLLGGVFLLFFALGLVLTFFSDTWLEPGWAAVIALTAGAFGVAWAYAGFRRRLVLLFALFPLQFAANWLLASLVGNGRRLPPAGLAFETIRHRLQLEGVAMILALIGSYVLIVFFIRFEGRRLFGTLTEMRLAHAVHQTLVPELSRRIGGFELYGISVPSGEVGGDLVDVIRDDSRWIAYVADVSGHGIPAGMIMAMVKSAMHTGASGGTPLAPLLVHVNLVLYRLSAPNVFATGAFLSGNGKDDEVEIALAGHHPILQYRSGHAAVEARGVFNVPLAILPDATFRTETIRCEAGDILAIVTDGLTEAADRKGNELTLDPLKQILADSAALPLPAVAQALRDAAIRHGVQTDDQSVLLVRHAVAG